MRGPFGAILIDARLEDAFLRRARLDGACLKRALLDRARLEAARLEDCSLVDAHLNDTCIEEVRLHNARLNGASLVRACFDGAILVRTSFDGAVLDGASFNGAQLGETAIGGVDLSRVVGLKNVIHRGPSKIATSTLERTAMGLEKNVARQGEVEVFLRGAGVSDVYLETFRLSLGQPIEFYSCFISYSHTDKNLARRLHDQLQARGIRCWLDEHDLKPGDRILDVVSEAIRLHDKILLCCSEASLSSWWVKDEIRKAQERERRDGRDIIIPLMVDRYLLEGWEDGLAADLRSRLAADFAGWEHDNAKFEEQFERVVKALRTD